MTPKEHPLWNSFCEWCKKNNGYDPDQEHEDDWKPWFDCFLSGSLAERKLQRRKNG